MRNQIAVFLQKLTVTLAFSIPSPHSKHILKTMVITLLIHFLETNGGGNDLKCEPNIDVVVYWNLANKLWIHQILELRSTNRFL